ncbi:MAG: pyruvate formate lyase family protein [Christensenellales bacterium]
MPIARIERLRDVFLNKEKVGGTSQEMNYLFSKGWLDNRNEYLIEKRFTLARAAMYTGMTPIISPDELIVGRPNHEVELTEEQVTFTRQMYQVMPYRCGQDSHMALDYEKLLKKGTSGVCEEILRYKAALDTVMRPEDISKETFYDQCLIMLKALEDQANHYACHALALSEKEQDSVRQSELRQIADNLQTVPKYPARTFWQALQSVHFLLFSLQGLYQWGRPDQYLLPFYLKDLKDGIITRETAQELINCACLMMNEITGKGLAVGLMVGGRDAAGRPISNDLTYMFIQAIRDVRLSYPGVGLCVTPETPEDLLRLSLKSLAAGHTHPALFNDELITQGLTTYGVPYEEAVSYIHSTCVEITPIKRSSVWVASPYHNLLAPLLEIMKQENERISNLEELLTHYKQKLRQRIRYSVYDQNRQQMERSKWYTHPLVSAFVDDCLERGADLDHGGARYAFIESSFVGMSNLVDSLLAVDALVYQEKRLTLKEFSSILDKNYEGYESLRQYILNKLPKYGNDQPKADKLFGHITEWIVDEMTHYRTWHGSRFIPGMFCWIMHVEIGKSTGATPDGRLSGVPLGDGSGPAQGRETKGPTASILSSTSWSHERFIGGIAVNLKFSKRLFNNESLEKLLQLVRTFMERGGFELQINVLDREKLLEARKHPEQYRDLVVRIGGYSDYFINLSEAMQEEVLLRTEHEL